MYLVDKNILPEYPRPSLTCECGFTHRLCYNVKNFISSTSCCTCIVHDKIEENLSLIIIAEFLLELGNLKIMSNCSVCGCESLKEFGISTKNYKITPKPSIIFESPKIEVTLDYKYIKEHAMAILKLKQGSRTIILKSLHSAPSPTNSREEFCSATCRLKNLETAIITLKTRESDKRYAIEYLEFLSSRGLYRNLVLKKYAVIMGFLTSSWNYRSDILVSPKIWDKFVKLGVCIKCCYHYAASGASPYCNNCRKELSVKMRQLESS